MNTTFSPLYRTYVTANVNASNKFLTDEVIFLHVVKEILAKAGSKVDGIEIVKKPHLKIFQSSSYNPGKTLNRCHF